MSCIGAIGKGAAHTSDEQLIDIEQFRMGQVFFAQGKKIGKANNIWSSELKLAYLVNDTFTALQLVEEQDASFNIVARELEFSQIYRLKPTASVHISIKEIQELANVHEFMHESDPVLWDCISSLLLQRHIPGCSGRPQAIIAQRCRSIKAADTQKAAIKICPKLFVLIQLLQVCRIVR